MFTTILVLLVLHTLLFKPKPGVLNCGLFGGSFNQQITDRIIWKLKTLGLFNQQRGSDSCGIYNGNVLVKGVDANKKFYDFVVNIGVPENDGTNNVFIGHTRNATIGAHTAENAHPFNIDKKLIFAHNGKIENIWPLCRENDIDPAPLNVDSQGLGHLVAKLGPPALELYKGYAAILAHELGKPGTLYAYHGASRRWKTDEKLEEERPMFFMKTPEGVYFSSMKEALLFIKEKNDEEPEILPHNIVYTIKDGKFEKKSKHIAREEKNVYVPPVSYSYPKEKKETSTNSSVGKTANWFGGYSTPKASTEEVAHNIRLETLPVEYGENKVYYYRNRYWVSRGVSPEICNGLITVDGTGKLVLEDPSIGKKRTVLYFFNGILLKGQKEYNIVQKQLGKNDSELMKTISFANRNFAKVISKWSKYPVTNVNDESKELVEEYRDKFYQNEKEVAAESITPLFSQRVYTYREGKLKSIALAKGGTPSPSFFLEPAPPQGGDGTGRTTNYSSGVRSGSSNSSERTKTADERRRDLVSDVCQRLRLSAVTPDIEKAIALFYTVYGTMDEIKNSMKGIGESAMKIYAIDLMRTYGDMEKPRDSIVNDLIGDIYYAAVSEKVPISELTQDGVEEIEYYIGEVLENWDFKDEDDVIEAAVVVDNGDDIKVEAKVIKRPFPNAPLQHHQSDLFKDFDKKKEFPY